MELSRVYLCPITHEHTESVLRWRSDPAVAAQLFSDVPPTRAGHEAWLASLQTEDRKEFVIVLRDGNLPVGTIGLSHIDRENGQAEFGILVGEPDARGKGVAHEASLLILRYAFGHLRLRRVVLNLFSDNTRARRLYQRLGFVENPARAGRRTKDGVLRPTAFMYLDEGGFQ